MTRVSYWLIETSAQIPQTQPCLESHGVTKLQLSTWLQRQDDRQGTGQKFVIDYSAMCACVNLGSA
jgi:hypothetical protein